MAEIISIDKFVGLIDNLPVIDVRSPSEYDRGHIPGAINIPLFSDEERAAVGTKYKKVGRKDAIKLGLELVGPKLKGFIDILEHSVNQKNILVYCWRGGMRSASMSWLFGVAGYKPKTLEGGYKAFRRFALETFSKPYRLLILGGMTGSGKTDILNKLKQNNEQVIDLEGLANHKGSAFGWINQGNQPKTEHFENLLFNQLRKLDASKHIWVEDESMGIGRVFIPKEFYSQMKNSQPVILNVDIHTRINRLIKDYTACDKNDLIESVKKIQKRLGFDKAQKCIDHIKSNNFAEAIRITLEYYDKTYSYGLTQKKLPPIFVNTDGNDDNLISKLIDIRKKLDA